MQNHSLYSHTYNYIRGRTTRSVTVVNDKTHILFDVFWKYILSLTLCPMAQPIHTFSLIFFVIEVLALSTMFRGQWCFTDDKAVFGICFDLVASENKQLPDWI